MNSILLRYTTALAYSTVDPLGLLSSKTGPFTAPCTLQLLVPMRYSYISAANGDIWTKFGLLIDFDLLKAATSTNTKPEVVFSGCGRHLEKWIRRHISEVGAPIWTTFGSLMQNSMQITAN